MEIQKNTDAAQDNGMIQNPANHSDALLTKATPLQNENNYDSHSEKKPHQETTVSTDANPDRVSHDTRDTTSKKAVGLEEEIKEDDPEVESEGTPFPKRNSSSFPSIS